MELKYIYKKYIVALNQNLHILRLEKAKISFCYEN